MPSINFFLSDTKYSLKNKNKIKDWIHNEVSKEKHQIEDLNIILCSDEYLYNINKDFLNHFYFTDVITFDNCYDDIISGEIYISVERVKENAKNFNTKVYNEFLRVIIHGVFHLLKYSDKTEELKQIMTKKENEAISNFYHN